MQIVSRPTWRTSWRFTASSAIRRTVQRAAPAGGALQAIAMIRCLMDGVSTSAAPGRGPSYRARAKQPPRYRRAILRTACDDRPTVRATAGERAP